jgi:hypothetical protein
MRSCEKIGWQAKAPAPQSSGAVTKQAEYHSAAGCQPAPQVGQTLSSVKLLVLVALALAPAAVAQTGFPFQDESLHYNVNWPSGLSLGEATFTAHHKAGAWDLAMTLDAGVPGFAVTDKIRSSATDDLCSLELERDIGHGARKKRETTAFDQKKGEATRTTVFPLGGGTSTLSFAGCPRDAMAFLYFARRELGQGRVAPPQQVFFGSAYSVRMDYTGAQTITVSDKPSVTDHLVVNVKGPKSSFSLEVFFARDAARTPLLIRVPLSEGTFSMELVR